MNFVVGGIYEVISRSGKGVYKSYTGAKVIRSDGENITLQWKCSKDFNHPDKDDMVTKTDIIKKADVIHAIQIVT